PALRSLLDRLHAISLEQEAASRGAHFPKSSSDKDVFKDRLVALDEDKCQAMYLLLRAMGARRVIEAGTSYGVSLLWLLAAVTTNTTPSSSTPSNVPAPLVIGTENEPEKAAKAIEHVKEAFDGKVPECLKLLEGDLLETLKAANLQDRSIDALLLDIWAPLALPTLKIIQPKLRIGGIVLIDNTVVSASRYEELLTYVRSPGSGFQSTILPHFGGFDFCVY
ncbi:S-adenosyl-L-methionine-dependent methyltransferase, partial [Meredithblackwellia eburnea MCA 4105]